MLTLNVLLRHSRRIVICLIAFLGQFGVAVLHAQENVLIHGDMLQISVIGYPEFSTSASIRDDGMITMPLIGDVPAAGLRKEDFIATLRLKLAEYIQGEVRVTVNVTSSIGDRVSVLGSVTRPDNYTLARPMGLLEILALAGGISEDGDMRRVKIFRKNQLSPGMEVDIERILESGGLEQIPSVQPGDVVFVPARRNFIKDMGEYLGYVALFFALFRLTDGIAN